MVFDHICRPYTHNPNHGLFIQNFSKRFFSSYFCVSYNSKSILVRKQTLEDMFKVYPEIWYACHLPTATCNFFSGYTMKYCLSTEPEPIGSALMLGHRNSMRQLLNHVPWYMLKHVLVRHMLELMSNRANTL